MLSLSQQHNPSQLSSCHHVVLVSATQPPFNSHRVTMLFLQLPQQYNAFPTVITSSRCLCLSSTTPFQLSSHRLCHNTTPVICHLVIAPSLSQQHNSFHLSSRHNAVPTTQSAFYSHPVKIPQTSCSPWPAASSAGHCQQRLQRQTAGTWNNGGQESEKKD